MIGILAALAAGSAQAATCFDKYGNWVEIADGGGSTSHGDAVYNCGSYSAAYGSLVTTNGYSSAAFGVGSVAVGDRATALGVTNFAGNHRAVAMGTGNNALVFPGTWEYLGWYGADKVQWTLGTVGERSVAIGYGNWTPVDQRTVRTNAESPPLHPCQPQDHRRQQTMKKDDLDPDSPKPSRPM